MIIEGLNFGSVPFNPPKQMPKGNPVVSYPAGTVIPGYPPIAKTVEILELLSIS
uniref:Uncharacterized protein n=1 Tax=Manihot esculenta TaxID=3983 RepID=A0A199UBL0_MANES